MLGYILGADSLVALDRLLLCFHLLLIASDTFENMGSNLVMLAVTFVVGVAPASLEVEPGGDTLLKGWWRRR